MDVFEALYTTRAMRRVTEEPIPEEILKQMVDAAIRAQVELITRVGNLL